MTRTLDLRTIATEARGKNVANLLAVLQEGESFTLLDDRDPKELLEKAAVEVPTNLRLDYLERGPGTWRLRLTRVAVGEEQESCCGFCGG